MARRWRRDAKYMNPPMMSRNGKNKAKLSIDAPIFRIGIAWYFRVGARPTRRSRTS
jgi:hypothetical protein